MNDKYPIIKTVYKFVLAGCWTDTDRINIVKDINNIPRTALHEYYYDHDTNVTTITIETFPTFG